MKNRKYIFNIILWIFFIGIFIFLGVIARDYYIAEKEPFVPRNLLFSDLKQKNTPSTNPVTNVPITNAPIETKSSNTINTKE